MRRSALKPSSSARARAPLCAACQHEAKARTVVQSPPPPLSERTSISDNRDSALRIAEKLTEKSGRSRDGQAEEMERLRQLVQGSGGAELIANFIRRLRKIALIVISIIIGITVLGSIFGTDTSQPPAPVVSTDAPVDSPEPTPVPQSNNPSVPSGPAGARPINSPGAWINSADYPARAIREQREGTTEFRVEVSREGRVTACTIMASSGHNDLDRATCSGISRRARFAPARDEKGEARPSTYRNSVRWVLPRD